MQTGSNDAVSNHAQVPAAGTHGHAVPQDTRARPQHRLVLQVRPRGIPWLVATRRRRPARVSTEGNLLLMLTHCNNSPVCRGIVPRTATCASSARGPATWPPPAPPAADRLFGYLQHLGHLARKDVRWRFPLPVHELGLESKLICRLLQCSAESFLVVSTTPPIKEDTECYRLHENFVLTEAQ